MTKAHRLLRNGTLDPDVLDIVAEAFDEVWASLAADFGNDPRTVEDARLQLAAIVLALAKDRQLGALEITRTAARLMRATNPEIRQAS
jgi:hypothetical protein